MTTQPDALEAIERILDGGGDADDVLRDVVAALHERAGYAWAGILFAEGPALVLGPEAGAPREAERTRVAVLYRGERVAELAVDGAPEADRPFLERVAALIAEPCLVGWDTGGRDWTP